MADYPVEQLSIQMRERIVLPLAHNTAICDDTSKGDGRSDC